MNLSQRDMKPYPWIRIQGVGCLVFEGTREQLRKWWKEEFGRDFEADWVGFTYKTRHMMMGVEYLEYRFSFDRVLDCRDGTGSQCYRIAAKSGDRFEVERYVQ